ncbi:MAG: tetratricopeptide repeat protein [Bdellovibrionales bacterium]
MQTSGIRILALFILTASSALAQNTTQPTVLTKASVGQQNLKIVYGSPAWNLDSTRPDSAFLFMRDKTSGKIVKIQLEETEPDSSIFSGSFAISMGPNGGAVDPQVYIPPRDMRNNDEAVKKFNQLLSSGQIQAKPLVVKASDSGSRMLDVYDTKDQVAKAQQAYANEQQAKLETKNSLTKPIVKTQELETAKKAEQQNLINQLAIEAAQREADRVRIEQIERQKILERERAAKALSGAERDNRKKKAAEFAAQALQHYQKGEFQQAEEKFRKSVELDPEDKSYYFRYGVTLYRTEKFNDALVTMKLSPQDSKTELEKKYYMGLIHLRLKELDPALLLMKEVGGQKQSELAASAAFYEGIIHFTKEDYEASREPFERVLDTSTDPRLDAQAEEYLDKLSALIQQKKMMSKRWFLSGMIGTIYDSNVLYAPDTETTQGGATAEGDIRLQASADAEYRPVYNNTHEAGVKAMGYYMVSSKDEVSRADPFLLNLAVPYSYKGNVFGKGSKAGFKPGFEMVYMDANVDGDRELVLQSILLNMDNTFVMRKDWFANYSLELRNDDSKTEDSTGDNNADAVKISLRTSQTFLLDKAMKQGLIGSAGYVLNQAKGDNKSYSRYELGVMYMKPTRWDALWNIGLSLYSLKFDKADTDRKDTNVTFSTGLTKPIKEWVSWNVSGSYSNNASSESDNQYSRYTLSASMIFNYSL